MPALLLWEPLEATLPQHFKLSACETTQEWEQPYQLLTWRLQRICILWLKLGWNSPALAGDVQAPSLNKS
jgi:hypothetical protein